MLFTAAERLIHNNWGVIVSNPEPERKGTILRMKREAEIHKNNKKKEHLKGKMTRQRLRAIARNPINR